MTGSILFYAIVFLLGAIIFVPIAKRFGLSSVLGYLVAGIMIGPGFLNLVGEEGQEIMHFAEFGVVVMLFLIGLEIEPRSFWKMRKTIVGMGGAQVVMTMLLSYFLLTALGQPWEIALTISMAIALSSTAIALQTIKEKGLLESSYGSSSFAILLFQDIIVIFMLGVLPLLSGGKTSIEDSHDTNALSAYLDSLPLGLHTLAIILSVVLVVLAGRYLAIPMLRRVATTDIRELLVAAAMLIVFSISFLMELVGLSPALGAFLGGVVLANSEFKHELESTLDPIKGLLLGLFFMAVGATINFMVIANNPLEVGGLVVGIILVKAIVLFLVGIIFKLKIDQRLLLTVGLAQVGEFAFVLLSFAYQLQIFDTEINDMMVVVTALTMTMTPILGMITERLFLPRIGTKEKEMPIMADTIVNKQKVLLVGFGHFGSTVGRFLRANGIQATILDQDSNRVDLLRKLGFEVYYGDASRMDLLASAGIGEADLLILAIDNPDLTLRMTKKIKKKYPNLKLLVRAKNRYDAYELLNSGIENVYRESLDTSVKMASDVLCQFGFNRAIIESQAKKFIRYDEESLRRLAEEPKNEEAYIFRARAEIALQEKLMAEDLERGTVEHEVEKR